MLNRFITFLCLTSLAFGATRYVAQSAGTFSGGDSFIYGSVTSGTFSNGETVTQASTGATATLVKLAGGSSGALIVGVVTGSPNGSNTWTGGTSGAVFTPSGSPLSNCNGHTAISIATFNGTTNSAGDVNYLCGIVTTAITLIGGGSSGGGVASLIFDAGAAVQVSPGCGSNGCLNITNTPYWLIDGGTNLPCGWNTATNLSEGVCNGQIENMLYGSSDGVCPGGTCTTQSSTGDIIHSNQSNLEIRNLEDGPAYVHTNSGNGISGSVTVTGTAIAYVSGTNFATCVTNACAWIVLNGTTCGVSSFNSNTSATLGVSGCVSNGTYSYAVGNDTTGAPGCLSGGGAGSWNIHDMKLHDGSWCVSPSYGAGTFTSIIFSNLEMYNNSHHFAFSESSSSGTVSGATWSGNYMHDQYNWDTISDTWHADAIHYFSSSNIGTFTGFVINNNIFGGNTGVDVSGQVFSEEFGSISLVMFNNLFKTSTFPASGSSNYNYGPAQCVSCSWYNNTWSRTSASGSTFPGSNVSLGFSTYVVSGQMENNISQGATNLFVIATANVSLSPFDYNAYGPNGGGIWNCLGSSESTFSAWQSACGEGTHSFYNSSSLGLSASYVPTSGSPLRSAGVNVCNVNPSFCTTYPAIKNDLAGNARPTGSTAWDIGALQYVSATQATSPTCTPGTTSSSSPVTETCTNPNSGTTVMCGSVSTTPVTNGAGTGCSVGTLVTSTYLVSSTATFEIVAGTSTLTDSNPTSYTVTITSTPTTAPAASLFADNWWLP